MHYVDKSLDTAGPWYLAVWKPTPGQQIAICDRCSTMLGHPMAVVNKEGRTLTVGCDCATALFLVDADEARRKTELHKLAQAEKAHAQQLREDLNARKLAEIIAILNDESKVAELNKRPHPSAYRAAQGDTLLGWAKWMLNASGATGRAKLLKTLRSVLGGK